LIYQALLCSQEIYLRAAAGNSSCRFDALTGFFDYLGGKDFDFRRLQLKFLHPGLMPVQAKNKKTVHGLGRISLTGTEKSLLKF
jgi:hypothetical protein